jgi:hypothetical protein
MSKNRIKREIVEEALKEHRRFRRVRLIRKGRAFIPATSEEVPCTISDISADGASVLCQFARRPAGKAVIYVGELGQFEGPIMAVNARGFTMRFACSRQKRSNLADQLTIELNRHLLNGSEPHSGSGEPPSDGDTPSDNDKYDSLHATD